jgi:signal transduction histidine kinase/AmiR/NasT family two-component response regulator
MSKTNILIVEDEAIVAADLAGKLKQLGYEIAGVAAGGEEAVGLASRLPIQLVLMDIWLKGETDGIEAARAIRRHQDVPVIYLTAHSDGATLARAKLTDPFGYILKPFDERELATQIEMALYKHETDRELRRSEARFKLLSETAGRLLATDDPQGIVNELCRDVMAHLDCHAFFNFLVDEEAGKLHLNACAGVLDEVVRKLEWLDYGVAVCGCVARDGVRIVAEDILHSSDPRTELVRSCGIQAYACHPLMAQGRLIGTLSFGSKTKSRFSEQDLALMKTVSDQVAVAMERIQLIGALQRSRDELEKRVQERTAALARSNRELQDFASIASHDLQEPLRKVQAFGNLLVEKHSQSLDDEARDYLVRMQSAAARMKGLIDSLLEYSRVTSRAKPFSEVDLNGAVKEALLNLEIRIKESGGRVEVDALPFIRADRSQIVQLFQNLIGNGLKFHKNAESPLVKVYGTLMAGGKSGEDGFLQITVEDNGIGFDGAKAERIFEPFQRLHGRSSPYAGTGMGLAICRKIVERHGGTITAKSAHGKGAALVITFPTK